MEDLKKEYQAKNTAFIIKYADVIKEIAIKNNKDLGVGADMLKAVARGELKYVEGIEFDLEEVKKDYAELVVLAERVVNA